MNDENNKKVLHHLTEAAKLLAVPAKSPERNYFSAIIEALVRESGDGEEPDMVGSMLYAARESAENRP